MELKSILYLFIFVASATLCNAHIGEMDDYWKKKLEAANAVSQASYVHDSDHITSNINQDPPSMMNKHHNDTSLERHGRSLLHLTTSGRHNKKRGPCMATNPIDRCWRCRSDWPSNRKHYATCAKGFGHNAIGGLHGEFYMVTSPLDEELVNVRYGTLRWGVIQDRPLWIIFAHDMNIRLQQELIVNSHKTIDGRGAKVHIVGGAGFTIQGVHNVIITNIYIHDIVEGPGGMIRDSEGHYGFRTKSDGDCISVFTGSNIWVDHVSFRHCTDGIMDAIENSTAITFSNNHMTHHDHVMLLGAHDEHVGDKIMQVTIAFNHFGKGLIQRMPRVRYGFAHVLNNDYTHWEMYAIGGNCNPTLLVEGNRFIAPFDIKAKEVTKREEMNKEKWKHWNWQSKDNILMNGAFFVESGKTIIHNFNRQQVIKAKPATYVGRLTRNAGPLPCKVGRPC